MPKLQYRNTTSWLLDDGDHPAGRFVADCRFQLDVCASLEAMAERLPQAPDPRVVAQMKDLLPSSWSAHIKFQTEAVFPLLRERCQHDPKLMESFSRFEKQHVEISGASDELVEQLESILAGKSVNAEMMGYQLRLVCDARRQHVEWEKLLLEPVLPFVLSLVERRRFIEWAKLNPWPFC